MYSYVGDGGGLLIIESVAHKLVLVLANLFLKLGPWFAWTRYGYKCFADMSSATNRQALQPSDRLPTVGSEGGPYEGKLYQP